MRFFSLLFIFLFLFSCSPSKKNAPKSNAPKSNVPKSNAEKRIATHGNMTEFKTITFSSKDSLTITADLYSVKDSKNFILLCHQAGFSRGEYIEAAKKLNNLGYSCLAIDQRSGKVANNVINETAKLAKEKGLKTNYFDAKPDIESAIDYAYKLHGSKIILVGSSYSAALSLLITTTNDKVKAVAAFSPGEYLDGVNLTESILALNKPTFVTSSKKEIDQVAGIIKSIKSKQVTHFKPEVDGIHGSRVLWRKTVGNNTYWKSFISFLSTIE